MGALELIGLLPARKNWALNPSLEVSIGTAPGTYGNGTGTFTRDSTRAWAGSWSAKAVIGAGAAWPGLVFSTANALFGAVVGSHSVAGAISVYVPVGSTVQQIFLRMFHTDGTAVDSTFVSIVGDDKWHRVIFTELITDPAKIMSHAYIGVGQDNPSLAATFWADAADIRIDEPYDSYIDGSQTNGNTIYTWSGSSHLSTSNRSIALPYGIVGSGGVTTVTHRIYKSNIRGEQLDELTEYVTGGEIGFDIDRDIKGSIKLEVSDVRLFDVYTWILVTQEIQTEREVTASGSVGLYRLGTPDASWPGGAGSVSGLDATILLKESAINTTTNYTGTYKAAIESTLNAAGFSGRYDMIDDARTLPTGGKTYPAGTSRQTIVNEFLQAIGFYTVSMRPSGRLGYKEYVDRTRVDPSYSYVVGESADLIGTIEETTNDADNFNYVIATRQKTDNTNDRKVAENKNSQHPYSTVSLGKLAGVSKVYRVKVVPFNEAADLTALQKRADLTLASASMLRTVTVSTLPDPYHEPHEVISLDLDAIGAEHLSGSYYVNSYTFGIAGSDSTMTIRSRRIESPDD